MISWATCRGSPLREHWGWGVKRTHQEIAVELGAAREVVSRHLKDFERQGSVALRRGLVELLDRRGLLARAAL